MRLRLRIPGIFNMHKKVKAIATDSRFMIKLIISILVISIKGEIEALNNVILSLYSSIVSAQTKADVRPGPGVWGHRKGLWASAIHINFNGFPGADSLRLKFAIPDDNMFVTNFITTYLIEAAELKAIELDPDVILLSFEALQHYQSHRTAPGVYSFWNEKLVDSAFVAWPMNLNTLLEELSPSRALEKILQNILDELKLQVLWPIVKGIIEWPDNLEVMFRIPPDSDDTAVNLALSIAIDSFASSTEHGEFTQQIKNVTSLISPSYLDKLFSNYYVKYAYRPFNLNTTSSDTTSAMIDTRTYFWLRHFLAEVKEQCGYNQFLPLIEECMESFGLFTTWFQSVEDIRDELHNRKPFNRAPFNINNVDPIVNANVVFGITTALLGNKMFQSEVPAWFAPGSPVEKLYENSVRLLIWILKHSEISLNARPDLVLTYYPPIFNFYFFVSRIYAKLSAASPKSLVPTLAKAHASLNSALKLHGTEDLLSKLKRDELGAYWEDFLSSESQHQDRLFSSATALNALLDIWTDQHLRELKIDTPFKVRLAILGGIERLIHVSQDSHIFNREAENAFFSGSVKSASTLPFYYPANIREDIKTGQKITCSSLKNITENLFVGVEGIIHEAQYEEYLKKSCFGKHVPDEFKGFSTQTFPFWSSPDLTKATILLALSKALAINLH